MNADPSPTSLSLNDNQKDLLFQTACRLVAATTRGTPRPMATDELGELNEMPVVGVFVTLRKEGHLRGCIGNFTTALPLALALERAATGVATRDSRFTPVLPSELPDLILEVSVLHSRELLGSSPQDRAANVIIGRHGLDIESRGSRGLLLPRVAVDMQLDPRQFLEEVCRKAGVPRDTWQERSAIIHRFGAICFGGPMRSAAG